MHQSSNVLYCLLQYSCQQVKLCKSPFFSKKKSRYFFDNFKWDTLLDVSLLAYLGQTPGSAPNAAMAVVVVVGGGGLLPEAPHPLLQLLGGIVQLAVLPLQRGATGVGGRALLHRAADLIPVWESVCVFSFLSTFSAYISRELKPVFSSPKRKSVTFFTFTRSRHTSESPPAAAAEC